MPNKLDELERSKKVIIVWKDKGIVVQSPLPETFGISTANEYTAPFEQYTSDSSAAALLRTTGLSNKGIGLFARQVWTGPDQQPFNLQLRFDAYYDAAEEVLLPVVHLLVLSSGTKGSVNREMIERALKIGRSKLESTGVSMTDKIADGIQSGINQVTGAGIDKVLEYIQYAKAPSRPDIYIGNNLRLKNVLITSVEPEFSSTLDYNNIPMSATVTISFTTESPLFAGDYLRIFGRTAR